jgi:predicted MFS family arabinose efflux permease
MALLNLCTSYSAWWQGFAVERIGYPATLVVDSVFGLVGLLLLPLMRAPRAKDVPASAIAAPA